MVSFFPMQLSQILTHTPHSRKEISQINEGLAFQFGFKGYDKGYGSCLLEAAGLNRVIV